MQSGDSSSDGGVIVGINVTPLVDITLVLLIIFIVTAKIIVTPAVPLDLPRAASTNQVQMVFSVIVPAAQGTVLVNGAPAPTDAVLLDRARAAATGDPEIRAVIQADGGVPYRRAIHVLDLLRQGGISRVAFAAASPEEAGPVR
jgi:biopolymer transport protein ExbD